MASASRVLNLRTTEETMDAIDRLAAETGHSRSMVARALLEDRLTEVAGLAPTKRLAAVLDAIRRAKGLD